MDTKLDQLEFALRKPSLDHIQQSEVGFSAGELIRRYRRITPLDGSPVVTLDDGCGAALPAAGQALTSLVTIDAQASSAARRCGSSSARL